MIMQETTHYKEEISGLRHTSRWAFDESHAKIGFSISHFGISETEGKFTKFRGEVITGEPDFSDAQIILSIDASSINTEDTQRDNHLKSPDFFDAENYPEIQFKSKSIESAGKNIFRLTGDLTMHGITREVQLDAIYRGTVVDPFQNTKAGFKVSGVIDRTQFGLLWTGTLAAGGLLVGHNVHLDINLELLKIQEAS